MNRSAFGRNNKIYSYYTTSKPLTRWDFLLLAIVLIAVTISLIVIFTAKSGNTANVYYKGELLYTYQLSQTGEYKLDIEGAPIISIKDNAIAIIHNSCKNQLCVRAGYISKANERIICAPNKITIVIKGSDKDFDAITGGQK